MHDKKAVDAEINEIRINSYKDIAKDLNETRLKTLSVSEQRLEDFKRKQGKGSSPQDELTFGDMLADYGNKVKKLDADLLKEKEKQKLRLEEKLRDRKQARLREIEEQRKQKEANLSADSAQTSTKITTEMNQITALLDPIKDEEERFKIILAKEKLTEAIRSNFSKESDQPASEIKLSSEAN